MADAAEQVCRYTLEDIVASLSLPGPEGWKYGALIPPDQFREMVLSDTYRIDDFLQEIGSARVVTCDEHADRSR